MFKKLFFIFLFSVLAYVLCQAQSTASLTQIPMKMLIAEKPLDCVTHIAGIQKIIADYCDQEWVECAKLPSKDITAFAASPDGRYIARALVKRDPAYFRKGSKKAIEAEKTALEIWDAETEKVDTIRVPINNDNRCLALTFAPDTSCLAVASDRIVFIDLKTQQWRELERQSFAGPATGPDRVPLFTYSSDGQYFAYTLKDNIFIQKINQATPKLINLPSDFPFFCITKICFSPKSYDLVIFGGYNGKILIADMQTGSTRDRNILLFSDLSFSKNNITLLPMPNCIALVPYHLPARWCAAGYLIINQTDQNNSCTKVYKGLADDAVVAIIPINEQYIAYATSRGDIKICAYTVEQMPVATDADIVHVIKGSYENESSLHCSDTGKYLTVAYKNGSVKRWINLSYYLLEKNKSKE